MTRRHAYAWLCALVLHALPFTASAEVRAWLDRARIGSDETATLNIETTDAGARPDYAPLSPLFVASDHASRRSFERVGGVSRTRMLYSVALTPARPGQLIVPALQVGGDRTAPLALEVSAARPVAATRQGPAFVEAELDSTSPYVQQAVGYVVRLYYAVPLISGELRQPPPDGATLQQVGSDVQYTREVGGRRYTVNERRFLLVPERSGTLEIPAAAFRGRGTGGLFDEMFGDGQRTLSADGPTRTINVRAVPANAPQPWLPLRALALRYLDAPRSARAGEAAVITVEATVDGAASAQAPELQLPAPAGAQVFADPAQVEESVDGGRPQLRIVRRFSIVPSRAGPLQVTGPSLAWWDVDTGRAQETSLPDIALTVAGSDAGTGGSEDVAAETDSTGDARGWIRVPGVQGAMQPWAMATVAFALLWLLTLAWALSRGDWRARLLPSSERMPRDEDVAESPAARPRAAPRSSRALRDAIDTLGPGEILALLQAMAEPPAADVDALRTRLAAPAQVAAVDALERARWHDGDLVAARQALRVAFADGPRWRAATRVPAQRDALPPLYPER